MNHHSLFSSGIELAELLVNSGLLSCSAAAILDSQFSHPLDPSSLSSVKYKVHHFPNITIVAFVDTVNDIRANGGDLVSSEELKVSFNLFDFVATKINPLFALHRNTVAIFSSLVDELNCLRSQLLQSSSSTPLIITGHCLGGSIASLFTLWLLNDTLPRNSKRPLCISFGSPLLGDKYFQQAISERPSWNSSFLHVISNKDMVPSLFINSTSQTCPYMPFGTFLLCSESSCSCFEEPESVLELLSYFAANSYQQNGLQITEYGHILEILTRKMIVRGSTIVDNSVTNLQAGIMMQLVAVGVDMQSVTEHLNCLTTTISERAKKVQTSKINLFDPNRKLTERKMDMTYLEWYKKSSNNHGGYYDNYKSMIKQSTTKEQIKTKQEVIKRHRILTHYWKKMVNEANQMPQKEGASFRRLWLYGGTNYRRLVEPLDIADYYVKGFKDYTRRGRSEHYVLLEKWYNEANNVTERSKASSLNVDSCFWAHVEEAVIFCEVIKDEQRSLEDKRLSRHKLVNFENYVMDLIEKFGVSSEIFLHGSSFMKWWEEYRVIVGVLDGSRLAGFMRTGYQNYA